VAAAAVAPGAAAAPAGAAPGVSAAAAPGAAAQASGLAGPPEWSSPAVLGNCPAAAAPQIIFPTESPEQPTGPGAIVWATGRECPAGAGARLDPISPAGIPQAPLSPRSAEGTRLGPGPPIEAAAAPHGLVAIAGTDPARASGALFIQGAAGGPFAPLTGARSVRPVALANGYLGDLGILAAGPGASGLSVLLERWYGHRVQPRAVIGGPHTGHISTAALALDYRSDALAVWADGGRLYAREEPGSGHRHPLQQLGPAGGEAQIAALLSDDDRSIVLWVLHGAGRTRIYLAHSAPGVRFGAPQLLESFADPDLQARPGAPRLIRLSDESVMAAWPGDEDGHWVTRIAPIDQNGLRTVTTIAAPGGNALLDGLAPGPDGEAIVLWGEPAQGAGGAPQPGQQKLMAARGVETAPGQARFGTPELVAGTGPVAGATVAVDPHSRRAIAAWVGEDGAVRWSTRGPETAG
jgi:hypothetical protein